MVMKKIFFVIFSILSIPVMGVEMSDTTSVEDKIRIYSGFRFGFGGAKQRNTVINKNDGNFVINPNMGAVLWVRFKQNFGLMAEANYSLKGIRFKNEKLDTVSIYQRRLHYFEFPLLVNASIGNQRFSEFVEIGVVPSFVSGIYDQNTQLVDGQPVNSTSQEFIYNKPLPFPTKRFDLSLLIGAGLGIKIGPGTLHTGFRTNIGLLDIYQSNRIGYANQPQRQFSFQIQFGYLWHIKSIKSKNS